MYFQAQMPWEGDVVIAFWLYSQCSQVDEESGGPEAKYARAYEARVNPFTDFQKNELEARVSPLCIK